MRKLIFFVSAVSLCFSCRQSADLPAGIYTIDSSSETVNPYLTTDNRGNAVLCWTERDPADSLYRLRYAVYNDKSGKFGNFVTVTSSAGTGTSPESMNKIGFKNDGTAVALFTRRFPNEKNPYAGAICYSVSTDHGKNWSAPAYLHSDTAHSYGRSFFDLSSLKDGELAAIWLDGRYGERDTGSALFFARTQKGGGFVRDTCIGKNTCECCRTELLTDSEGNLHVAYRAILYPAGLMGRQVRDMVYQVSEDNGRTFSKAAVISRDNWEIEGCPHTGPSLAVSGKKAHALWFTGGGMPGLYYNTIEPGKTLHSEQISTEGRHPQMVSFPDGSLAMVWEEAIASGGNHSQENMSHSHMGMHHRVETAGASQIVLKIMKDGEINKTIRVTDGHKAEHHAVISTLKNGDVLLAWMSEDSGHSGIRYTIRP